MCFAPMYKKGTNCTPVFSVKKRRVESSTPWALANIETIKKIKPVAIVSNVRGRFISGRIRLIEQSIL
ncbi:hypothetical protein MAH4_35420 [Sessilibacter sp. MAH4]